ncbi:EAL domain-containing protein [Alicyclobacillus ferrooxydans]|uniref:EAL domain-containing protein n=1 Tax=Alicyclobacillus ferrooxydans TaxID=471514 RepID=UPI000A502A04|nr:EAL domain-containing protein [Alicyclobacillus ferrooxydans]
MNTPECAACQGRTGIVIAFPDRHALTAVLNGLHATHTSDWRLFENQTIWFSLSFAYNLLPYWEEFHTPEDWQMQYATLSADGRVEYGDVLHWQDFRVVNPSLWVEDIVREQRLRMMMQPIVDLAAGRVVGYELLARGISKDNEVISPLKLYQAAREQNQLFRLDRACRICGIETGQEVPADALMFINFIPTSIYVPEHCLATTIAAAERCGIERNRVVFEVVETDLVEDMGHLRRILEYYRKQGFQTALDDVGTGYNNLDVLAALEPDIVKLDRAFVSDIHESKEKRDAAKQILEAGRKIGARMLAEGVERPEEGRVLLEMGYEWQQGYWYGRPDWKAPSVPAERMAPVQIG